MEYDSLGYYSGIFFQKPRVHGALGQFLFHCGPNAQRKLDESVKLNLTICFKNNTNSI